MTMSAVKKPERKWLDRSVRTNVDQTKFRIRPAAEIKNRTLSVRQVPEHQNSVPDRLDRCKGLWQTDTRIWGMSVASDRFVLMH